MHIALFDNFDFLFSTGNWPFDDFEGKHADPPPDQLVFYGDSDIEFWDVNESFPAMSVLNCGVSGCTMAHVKEFGQRFLQKYRPKVDCKDFFIFRLRQSPLVMPFILSVGRRP